ncbi:MAG: FtsQ-type POTRA domain-containing protein [Lachnospiraceae bacterium]|nr:FtsQ-type POTRA domain-containing protein [Lachnospiraceae bacterium]
MRILRRILPFLIVLALLGAGAFGIWRFLEDYRIDPDKVYVEGNRHYSDEQIREIVMEGPLGDNSWYLSHKYRDMKITDVPFVASITVSILSRDAIRITVYEKALAGYVTSLDQYIYFDKDGIVVESSTVKTPGIPQVTGLAIYSMELGKPLTEDTSLYTRTLDLTKLLDKYSLTVDRIHYHDSGKVTLYFGDVRVALGSETDRLEDKIMLIPEFLKDVGSLKGALDMERYNDKGTYFFKKD